MDNRDLSGEMWLGESGYFYANPHADHGTVVNQGDLWKNSDFLRLKDEPLFLLDPKPGMTVLELGCAGGSSLIYCGLQGATVVGVDLDETRIEQAQEKFDAAGIDGRAMVGDCQKVDIDECSVDAVLSSDFHEHLTVDAQVAVLSEAWRVLKPGGVLALKTPNLTYLTAALWFKRARALSRGKTPFGLVIPHRNKVDMDHLGLLGRHKLAGQLEEAGFGHYRFHYAPLRRMGRRALLDVAAVEVPVVRDVLCEDLIVKARKPIALAHFPA